MNYLIEIVMKPFIVISMVLALFTISQKCQQHPAGLSSGCPAVKTEFFASPQPEPIDTVQTVHHGKVFPDAMFVL